jgi:tagatose-6-phosphate ketose/aldose isomerase
MTVLGMDAAMLAARGGEWTAREIAQQPGAWAEVAEGVARAGLAAWLAPRLAARTDAGPMRIVLTGAGTSAFVGECLAPLLARALRRPVEAIATTDLVSAPRHWLHRDVPTLLVSFARSGNSPESVAAVQLAERLVTDCHHFIVTCNAEGALAAAARDCRDALVHVLPARTNDRGFAMTSSFTSMLGAAAHAFGVLGDAPGAAGADVIERGMPFAAALAGQGHARVVFLGANALKGLAHEAALKMLELTDGRVVAVHESPLGFRHGPKTIVDATTLVVLFLSADPHARRYDLDLLRELRADGRAGRVVAVGTRAADARSDGAAADFVIGALEDAGEAATLAPMAVFAQMLALRFSIAHGLTPDEPCVSGTVHRVVRGVTIHALDDDGGDGDDNDAAGTLAAIGTPTGGQP